MNNKVLELPRRNAESVMERLRQMEIQLVEQQQRIDGLNASISGFILRMQALEQYVAQQRIAQMGKGPTCR
jgi:hypothetical protein